MPDTRGLKAHESGVGLFSGSHRSSGPFEGDRICRSGGGQRWGAGGQTEPFQDFCGGIWRMNRGENAEAALAAGAFENIDFEGTVFILHLPQWN